MKMVSRSDCNTVVCVCVCVFSSRHPAVCVGGCGGGAFHSAGSAPDPAALQAGREDCQEHLSVSEEALPQRARVSISLAFCKLLFQTPLSLSLFSWILVRVDTEI